VAVAHGGRHDSAGEGQGVVRAEARSTRPAADAAAAGAAADADDVPSLACEAPAVTTITTAAAAAGHNQDGRWRAILGGLARRFARRRRGPAGDGGAHHRPLVVGRAAGSGGLPQLGWLPGPDQACVSCWQRRVQESVLHDVRPLRPAALPGGLSDAAVWAGTQTGSDEGQLQSPPASVELSDAANTAANDGATPQADVPHLTQLACQMTALTEVHLTAECSTNERGSWVALGVRPSLNNNDGIWRR
jgi:hypothetical protein